MSSSDVGMLLNVLRDLRVTNAVNLASLAILLYDILLTFREEVEYVWKAQWSYGKVLFFLNRYPIVVVTIFLAITDVDVESSPIICRVSYQLDGWSMLAFILPVQLIFALRTYALWERNRKILAFLIGLVLACDSVIGVFIWMSESTGGYVLTQHSELRGVLGCYATMLNWTSSFQVIIPAVATLMAFDAIVLILTVFRYISIRNDGEGDGSVLSVLIRDGIVYYVAVLASNVANLVLYALLPKQHSALIGTLVPLLRTAMSVCANRLMLNLRGAIDRVRSRTHTWSSNSQSFRRALGPEQMDPSMELQLRLHPTFSCEYRCPPSSSGSSLKEAPRTPMSMESAYSSYRPRSTAVVNVVTSSSDSINPSAISDVLRGDGDHVRASFFGSASTLLDTTVSCEGIVSAEWIGIAV